MSPAQLVKTAVRRVPRRRPGEQEETILFLELDQLVADRKRPLPRAHLDPKVAAALLLLRLGVTVLAALVVYAFIASLS